MALVCWRKVDVSLPCELLCNALYSENSKRPVFTYAFVLTLSLETDFY